MIAMHWLARLLGRNRFIEAPEREALAPVQSKLGKPVLQESSFPPFECTIARVEAALAQIETREKLRFLLFTSRPEYFDTTDLLDPRSAVVESVKFVSDTSVLENCAETFDVAIVCTHIGQEHKAQFIVRQRKLAALVVVWCWDNHHSFEENLRYNSLADIVLPAHQYCSDKLKTPHSVLGRSFPLPTAQWSRSLSSKLLLENADDRSNSLSGGYVLWSKGGPRNDILQALQRDIPGNALCLMDENNRGAPYFRLSAEARFREWTKYKVSIALPLVHDISLRIFDALIAGQIPIVPTSCYDLDAVIPPPMQETLPVIRIGELSPKLVEEKWRLATERFDKSGVEGITARHRYACDHHHIVSRIGAIAEYLKQLSRKRISVVMNDEAVGLVAGMPQPEFPPFSARHLQSVINLSAFQTQKQWPGASTALYDSGVRIATDSAPWSYAALAQLPSEPGSPPAGWYWIEVSFEVESGEVGFSILMANGQLKSERFVSVGSARARLTLPFLRDDIALLIRNGARAECSQVILFEANICGMPIPENAYP